MKIITSTEAQRRYDAMEPPDDPCDDLNELSSGELQHLLDQAEAVAEDYEVPARVRHQCDAAIRRIRRELDNRR